MKSRLILLAALALASCASPDAPRVVGDQSDRIVLSWFRGTDLDDNAWRIARRHCADQGRVPLVGERTDRGRAIKREYLCSAPPDEAGPGVTFHAGV